MLPRGTDRRESRQRRRRVVADPADQSRVADPERLIQEADPGGQSGRSVQRVDPVGLFGRTWPASRASERPGMHGRAVRIGACRSCRLDRIGLHTDHRFEQIEIHDCVVAPGRGLAQARATAERNRRAQARRGPRPPAPRAGPRTPGVLRRRQRRWRAQHAPFQRSLRRFSRRARHGSSGQGQARRAACRG